MKTALLILVIGDSIAHGWAPYLPAQIPETNCRGTRQHLEHLDEWTQGKRWDAIVFNCGLHDIQQQVTLNEYEANLRAIVHRLKPRCTRLYFCSITPGRPRAPACTEKAVLDYNHAALDVMAEMHVPVIDLYGPCMTHRQWWMSDYDIHYTPEGYRHMAEIVQKATHEP